MDIREVKKAIKGDDEALYQLINKNKDQLYRIAYSYLKNQDDALEAIQVMTFKAYENINKIKKPQYFKTWIIRILINHCSDELKRRKKVMNITKKVDVHRGIDKEEKISIETAVNKLKPKYKEVIVLKYYEDMTISEIADIMKCPEGTIKTRLSRGLAKLRSYLGKGGEYNNV